MSERASRRMENYSWPFQAVASELYTLEVRNFSQMSYLETFKRDAKYSGRGQSSQLPHKNLICSVSLEKLDFKNIKRHFGEIFRHILKANDMKHHISQIQLDCMV
jgi:hypothetical protein